MTESTERMGFCERCGRLLLASDSDKPIHRLRCDSCSENTLRTSLGLRGGLIAASLFGLSVQAPVTALARPPADSELLYQVPEPMYGAVPAYGMEPIIETRVVKGHIARISTIEGNSAELEVEILGIGQDLGVRAGQQATIIGLNIVTVLTRCEAKCCYANVAATEHELTENPDVEVIIVEEVW